MNIEEFEKIMQREDKKENQMDKKVIYHALIPV